jgi:hypothetical protein
MNQNQMNHEMGGTFQSLFGGQQPGYGPIMGMAPMQPMQSFMPGMYPMMASSGYAPGYQPMAPLAFMIPQHPNQMQSPTRQTYGPSQHVSQVHPSQMSSHMAMSPTRPAYSPAPAPVYSAQQGNPMMSMMGMGVSPYQIGQPNMMQGMIHPSTSGHRR